MSQFDSIQQSIQAANVQIAELNQLLAQLRAICPSDDRTVVDVPEDLQAELQAAGIVIDPTQDITGTVIKTWIDQIKDQIDALNSAQQLSMIQLQSQMNKQNEAYDLLSRQIKQMQDATNSVINNMR
ncbi:putative secreted protein [Paenibacillus curdlanolyticus YK9]|uniref:Putative secreted protein n=1 Tax=Paenibacillus curdlanolyticus YK9 TaxID=717606 RepID=E0IF30_9BACL|nr:hypothetical protein [Paenibacillus curdlanolyticus]EFM08806.1 putative secreted protein [Paenibacillus curdlanolyticus YK9]